ncbi:MAG: hemolysin family protein [Deinococcota bacterium]
MGNITVDIVLLLILIVANGVFAMAEAAVVAARQARLQQRADTGNKRAQVALELSQSPNRFLATVQIGITLIGIFAGAFGGATLSEEIARGLRNVPLLAPYADSIGLAVVVLIITYLSLIIGELVPKRIGLHSPERIASIIAVPMRTLSKIAAPIVWLLSASTELVLRLIGLRPSDEPPVSEEEINVMMEQGRRAGVFAKVERDIVQRVFELDDRTVSSLMTRRPDVLWLDTNDDWEVNRSKLNSGVHSRLPVCHGSLDNVIGIVSTKDLLRQCLQGQTPDLTASLQDKVLVPETLPAFKLLEAFKTNLTHVILVIDEYAVVQGLVTLNDVLTAVVGDVPSIDDAHEPFATQRKDGSWLLDGMLPIEEFKEIFELDDLPGDDANYQTLSGFVMTYMGRIPEAAEQFEVDNLRFEVVDMDGHIIDKVLVREQASPEG